MSQWITVCPIADILPGTGVCALIGDRQVAVFRPYADEQVFAISNIDPFARQRAVARPHRRASGRAVGRQPAEETAFPPVRRPLSGRRQPFRRQLRQPGGRRHRARRGITFREATCLPTRSANAPPTRAHRPPEGEPARLLDQLGDGRRLRRPRHHPDLHPRQLVDQACGRW